MCNLPTQIHEGREAKAAVEKAKSSKKDYLEMSMADLATSYMLTA